MEESHIKNSDVKIQALVNEYKGNLFEYLVAHKIALDFGIESQFISSISDNYRDQLIEYEYWLRNNEIELLRKIPSLANRVVCEVKNHVLFDVKEVFLLGKVSAPLSDKLYKEADILLKGIDKLFPISLKLCKSHAYVNTKSGGVKSFIKKYFSSFLEAENLQNDLNSYIDLEFNKMAHDLHSYADLNFTGSFTKEWTENGFSELPGELPENMRVRLLKFYQNVIQRMYKLIVPLSSDRKKFKQSLAPLVGRGREDIFQITCFHKSSTKENYLFDSLDVSTQNDGIENYNILELRDDVSFFEIEIGKKKLQIRVKPMNKFTAPSMKVNCSVK